ncbi:MULTISPECIES: TonB-dependent receptor [unclassified Caulobacter]|uniref:TonB-dependent receptor domain-containing protein n=1 Tax=unclassified Caulobacter TaxID=2648921 RepID=UPI00068A6083|nr:TonB-dependent receptor [Caulobacter sp. UNC358MFTsu5.1]
MAGVIALSAAPTAFAQTSSSSTASSDSEVEALVVTGSRIKRNEYTSASPIQVITSEQSTLQGLADTGDILQKSSAASGSFQSNNLLTGYVITGGENISSISLRGLGANRTLVLLNGRRLAPAGQGGTVGPVDLNVLPSSIIDRTEILKDGASSIYGSDAVAGVVNIMTKKDFDGVELNVYGSVPARGEGETYRISGTAGKVFDKGYINLTADYNEQKALKVKDRKYTSCAEDYRFDAVTGERVDFIDPATGHYKCYNAVNNAWQAADVYGGIFQYDPTLSKAPPGGYPAAGLTTRGFLPDWVRAARAGQPATYPYANYDNAAYQNSDAISPVKRGTIYLTGSYDITPNVEAYTEVLLNRRKSSGTSIMYLFETVSGDNPNNSVAAGLQAGGASGDAIPLILLPHFQRETIDYGRVVGGLRGTINGAGFLNNWDWDVYGQYGKSDAKYTSDFIYADRVYATTGGSGLGCDPSEITISGGSCMNIDYFNPNVLAGNLTPAQKAFLIGQETGTTKYTQYSFEGSISGDLFTLPAGPVGAAFGATYRKDKLDDTPGFNAQNANYWGYSTAGRTAGSDDVKEIYGELAIPIFKDLPAIEKLDLSLSGRYTDYKSYGSDETYKVGLNWQLSSAFRIRSSYGTSFRAPALYELYLADQTSFFNGVDPCRRWGESTNTRLQQNCAAAGIPDDYVESSTPLVSTGGGVGRLKAETSKAATFGVIWTPSFMDLSLALDYFDIEVNNEVANFGAGNILNACYGGNNYPNDFCSLFNRDPVSHDVTIINDNYLNVASQKNRGLDFNSRYQHEFTAGKLTIDGQFTWQFEDVTNLLEGGEPDDHNGETTEPDFTGVINTRFDHNDWTVNWAVDMYGKASDTELIDGGDIHSSTRYNKNLYSKQYTEFTAYHSLTVRKKFDNLSVQLGVLNVFDELPPAQSAGQFRIGVSALNAYDLRGRRFVFEINKRW